MQVASLRAAAERRDARASATATEDKRGGDAFDSFFLLLLATSMASRELSAFFGSSEARKAAAAASWKAKTALLFDSSSSPPSSSLEAKKLGSSPAILSAAAASFGAASPSLPRERRSKARERVTALSSAETASFSELMLPLEPEIKAPTTRVRAPARSSSSPVAAATSARPFQGAVEVDSDSRARSAAFS